MGRLSFSWCIPDRDPHDPRSGQPPRPQKTQRKRMNQHGAVAISSAIIVLAGTLLVGIGFYAREGYGNLPVGVGGLLGLIGFISWVAALRALERGQDR